MYSMTGFARIEEQKENRKIVVEIRSLNSSRGCEISLKAPHLYKVKEIELRKSLSSSLKRGKIDVFISEKNQESDALQINEQQVGAYIKQLQKIDTEFSLDSKEHHLSTALRLPESLSSQEKSFDEQQFLLIESVFLKAIKQLQESRAKEGLSLKEDLSANILHITKGLEQVISLDAKRIESIKSRIKQHIERFVEQDKIDQNRFEQELIYYIEKLDISEETSRLKLHIDHFNEVLIQSEMLKGKKLGFITQEIGREINTTGSKASDAQIQKVVVGMKEALEKIKEQLANVL